MTKYIIDENYFKEGLKFYSLEDIFCQKRPNLSKFQCKKATTNNRIYNTWSMLGPINEMKDKVGHKFLSIFLKYLKDTEGVQIYPMTEEQAQKLNQ